MALSLKQKEGETIPFAKKAFCLVVMAIALMVVLMSSRPMLSKPLVEAKLHSFSDLLSAHFKQAGGSAEFTWQDVDVHSLGSKAIVMHPVLTLSDPSSGTAKTTFATDKIVFVPVREKDIDYKVLFPSPITITDAGGHVTEVHSEGGMPIYNFGTRKEDEIVVFAHQLQLPPKLAFSTPGAVAPAGQPLPGTTLSFASDPTISLKTYSDGRNKAEVSFQNVVVADNAGAFSMSLGSIKADMHDDVAKDGRIPFESVLALADLSLKAEQSQQGPYTIKLSLAGSRIVPAADGTTPNDVDMTLRDFSIGSEKFTIAANGSILRKPEDPLPFGKVDVKIDHFAALRDSAGIPANMKPILIDAFNRITGADASKAEDVQFSIAREKQGKTTIGSSSPEELAGLVLSHAVAGGGTPAESPSPAPASPSAGVGGMHGAETPVAPIGGMEPPKVPAPVAPAPAH